MSKSVFVFLFSLFISIWATGQNTEEKDFKFHLNHVDLSVDSFTFKSILDNEYLRDSFSFLKVFTDSTGSEILLYGQEHFIHILPEKGFFERRRGACLLVHHNYKWRSATESMNYLQSRTTDSLYDRPYISPQINISYINVYEKPGNKLLKFAPILQIFSKENYVSWGYTPEQLRDGISQKAYMQDYLGKETADKIFGKIRKIYFEINPNELDRIRDQMMSYGYQYNGKSFSLEGSPEIQFQNMEKNFRKTTIWITLARKAKPVTIFAGHKMILAIHENSAMLRYETSD